MNYSVGQVLYLLMNKEKTVVPVQVVEKLLRTTLNGESISYIVELPTKSRDRRSLDNIESSVYVTIEDVKNEMLDNASQTIDKIIEKSHQLGVNFFPSAYKKESSIDRKTSGDLENDENDSQDEQKVEVDLGDGVKGNIILNPSMIGE